MRYSDFKKAGNVRFNVDSSRYVIAKLKTVPAFADGMFLIIKDKNEVTVVAREDVELRLISEERFFKLITFDVKLPFDLTGFLSHVSTLLSNENIPLLAFSAYSTDHILVKEEFLEKATEVLRKDGMMKKLDS